MSNPQYPLEQVTIIKQKKLDEAEKALKERKVVLDKESDKLTSLEKDRDTVKKHRDEKLEQFREKLDEGTTTDKIQQMRLYLKEVDEKLKLRETKVKEQKKVVEAAEKKVEEARQEMLKRQHDMEKMRLHRKEWEKEIKIIQEQKEAIEMDETGSALYSRKKTKESRNRNN